VLDRHSVAGFVYGAASTFHIYFETDPSRLSRATSREDIETGDASRLKGMPGSLVMRYQQLIRAEGVDFMSSTGGVTSAAHTNEDLDWMERAFDVAIASLLHEGHIATVG
jgi:glutamate-1-semialdehyde aminotransferase